MNSRRTEIKLTFDGTDISEDINKYFQTMTYTDNEEDKSDDLQIVIDDREDVWIGQWLASSQGAGKGAVLSAVIVQKNFYSDGGDRVLDCGVFAVDTVSFSGPPTKVTLKAASIPADSTIKTQKKTKAWENFKLSAIVGEIAGANGLASMFESAKDPFYKRVEQVSESDISFLQQLCKNAGISLKVTAKMIVLFLASEYEAKTTVSTIEKGVSDITKYSFDTTFLDTAYSSCHVQFTDSLNNETYEATYVCPSGDTTGQILELNEQVGSNGEAMELAEMRLREKNKNEYSASFTLVGNTNLVAGLTVDVVGYGTFDGKYIIETATHTVTGSGYTTALKLRQVLEGY
ncbi:MAG: contractile injection system protein, VgrG/Pvc8 family [Eubacteriales bacterium]